MEEKTVTMTRDEWNKLVCYLIMSTNYREGERDAWAKLAEEKDANGELLFPNAAGNAAYWSELCVKLDEIRRKIDEVA